MAPKPTGWNRLVARLQGEVPAAELEKAKNLIVTGALRERETSNGKAFSLGEALILQHDPSVVNTGLAKVQAVTPADIQRVARQYLAGKNHVVISIVPQGKTELGAQENQ